jgi:phosphate transport system substrate-binding protein
VKRNLFGKTMLATASLSAIAGMALSACGSDNTGATGTSAAGSKAAGSAECGGKSTLTAEGSTAQQNAIAVFNQAWGQACPGKNLPTTRPARVPG